MLWLPVKRLSDAAHASLGVRLADRILEPTQAQSVPDQQGGRVADAVPGRNDRTQLEAGIPEVAHDYEARRD
jgi:hypothetical protein